jgi:hypothetical protein
LDAPGFFATALFAGALAAFAPALVVPAIVWCRPLERPPPAKGAAL